MGCWLLAQDLRSELKEFPADVDCEVLLRLGV